MKVGHVVNPAGDWCGNLDNQRLIAYLNSTQTVGPAVRTELSPLLSLTDTAGSITWGAILLNLLWSIASRLISELTLCWTQMWDIMADVVRSAAWLMSQFLWKGQGFIPLHNVIHFFSHLAERLQVADFPCCILHYNGKCISSQGNKL